MAKEYVAIYLDFENLAISSEQVYPKEEMPLQIEPIVDYAGNKGPIAIKKAYANWNYPMFRQYQRMLLEQGFDLIHLPETTVQGKSWADMRITISILEDLALHPHLQTFVLGSQDTDFIPIVQAVKSKGREVIVAGFGQFVGNLLKKNCTEFISLNELFTGDAEPNTEGEEYDVEELFRRLLAMRSPEEPIFMTNLKQDLLKLDPSFSERQLGFASFSQFAKSLVGKYIERIDRAKDRGVDVVFLKALDKKQSKKPVKSLAVEFLSRGMKFVKQSKQRREMINAVMLTPEINDGLTLPEIIDIAKKVSNLAPIVVNKYIFQLYNAGVLEVMKGSNDGPLFSRKMIPSGQFQNTDSVERAYLERMRFLVASKFPSLSDKEVAELMGETAPAAAPEKKKEAPSA
ncbi:MAG: NYN domain-containing protein [Bacteroidia bacterium]